MYISSRAVVAVLAILGVLFVGPLILRIALILLPFAAVIVIVLCIIGYFRRGW